MRSRSFFVQKSERAYQRHAVTGRKNPVWMDQGASTEMTTRLGVLIALLAQRDLPRPAVRSRLYATVDFCVRTIAFYVRDVFHAAPCRFFYIYISINQSVLIIPYRNYDFIHYTLQQAGKCLKIYKTFRGVCLFCCNTEIGFE